MTMLNYKGILQLIMAVSLLGILVALALAKSLLSQKVENEKVKQIQQAIKEGAQAYLSRQAKIVSLAAAVIFILLFKFFGLSTAAAFLAGSFASGLCGFLGMSVSVRANARVAEAAGKSFAKAFLLSFRGGSVTGFLVASLALLSTTLTYYYFVFIRGEGLSPLVGLAFGASLISVFARLGGGIYTKAADVGTDLVGKVEAGIPEDDPRNPGVIADNVGDNVGDCAGMAADLFETYCVTLISAILLANLLLPQNLNAQILPLAMGAVALLACLSSLIFVRGKHKDKIMNYLYRGLFVSVLLSAVAFYPLIVFVFKNATFGSPTNLYLCALLGLVVTLILVFLTDFYTAKNSAAVKEIATASQSGHGTNIIAGLALSLKSTFPPIALLTFAAFFAFRLSGLYGVALSAVSLLSLAAMIVAIDSFGPITDNAGGIAEMANLSPEIREITDSLDAVGNTTKAVTKGYAIGSAILSALIIFTTYTAELSHSGQNVIFSLSDPYVLVGLFLGAALPYLFAAWSMEAVGKAAGSIVTEIRRQFKEIPGIMAGTSLPDYRRAVDIVTQAALSGMTLPALLPVVSPILVGLVLGPKALGGLLIGALISGAFLAISMTTGGAAWDNAKKYIEDGHFGGKGSFAHQAAVTGDTVGDPYKDTAGPAINPMIKILNIVALLMVKYI